MDHFKIGYVSKSHGLKGEVTIVLGPECPDLEDVTTLFVENGHQQVPYFIESISVKGVKAYLKLEGVNTPEAAAGLKGCSLLLPKSDRPRLPRGEFYNDEVIGFEVGDKTKGVLGLVREVEETGPNRFLIVVYGQKEVMIPVNGPFITSVNKTKKKIAVDLPDGLLDL